MPNFDSPLGSKKFAGTPLKEFDIPDESDYQSQENSIHEFQMKMQREQEVDPAEVECEIRAARDARRIGKELLSTGAKRRIEMLLGMTRSTRSADIEGNVFVFQSLKGKEMRAAIIAAAEYDNTVQSPFEIRKQLLARSIVSIAGIEIEQFIGTNTLDARLTFIEELDESLLNRLYGEYLILSEGARKKFAIKTDVEATEVVADLGKA